MEPNGVAAAPAEYEPPRIERIGTLVELTNWCILGKTLGSPDYWSRIPIANCSS